MVRYSHLFKIFPQFVVIHKFKGFSGVSDGCSPCPAPQHSLILIHRLFHVQHGHLFPLQR